LPWLKYFVRPNTREERILLRWGEALKESDSDVGPERAIMESLVARVTLSSGVSGIGRTSFQ